MPPPRSIGVLKVTAATRKAPLFSFPSSEISAALIWHCLILRSNGHLDLVVTAPARAGYYRHEYDEWQTFRPFERAPTSLSDQQTQYIDLSGNWPRPISCCFPAATC